MARRKKGDGDKPRTVGGRRVMSLDAAMSRGLTGRRAKTLTWYQRVKDLAKTHGDEGARERLGVSKSTWRAWTNKDRAKRREPNAANRQRIVSEHNTRDVRRATMSRRRTQKMARNGVTVKVTGLIGPIDTRYARVRQIATQFPPETAELIMNAFIDGGPEAAAGVVRDALDEFYFGHPVAEFSDLTEFDAKGLDPEAFADEFNE